MLFVCLFVFCREGFGGGDFLVCILLVFCGSVFFVGLCCVIGDNGLLMSFYRWREINGSLLFWRIKKKKKIFWSLSLS